MKVSFRLTAVAIALSAVAAAWGLFLLTVVLPALVLGAVLMWRKQAWGVILGAIMLVKCATYGMVLVVSTLLLQWRGIAADALLPFYLFILLGGLAGLWWLLARPGSI